MTRSILHSLKLTRERRALLTFCSVFSFTSLSASRSLSFITVCNCCTSRALGCWSLRLGVAFVASQMGIRNAETAGTNRPSTSTCTLSFILTTLCDPMSVNQTYARCSEQYKLTVLNQTPFIPVQSTHTLIYKDIKRPKSCCVQYRILQ